MIQAARCVPVGTNQADPLVADRVISTSIFSGSCFPAETDFISFLVPSASVGSDTSLVPKARNQG